MHMAVISVMSVLGGKDISLAKVVSGEKVSSEEFTIWVVTADVLCPTTRKILNIPLPLTNALFLLLVNRWSLPFYQGPYGPMGLAPSAASDLRGSASATDCQTGSSGCKCLPEVFTPRNSPLLPSPLVSGWPLPVLLSASTTFRLLSLLLWALSAACLCIPYLSFRLHTHSMSSVYRCLSST